MSDVGLRAMSALGFCCMIGVAWLASRDRRLFPLRTVLWGVGLQLSLALLLLKTPARGFFLRAVNELTRRFLAYSDAGIRFVFRDLMDGGFSIAVNVLPIIIFMGSLFSVLYYLGIIQRIVAFFAWLLSRGMGLSGAESLAAVANLFVGMVESALVVRPYLERMTRSELFTLMTMGMATVAGSVLFAYARILGEDFAGHLVIASLLSAPAGLMIAKIMQPEREHPETLGGAQVHIEPQGINLIDAAANGAIAGLRLAAYVGAMLVAFVALIAVANDIIGELGALVGLANLSLEKILGVLLAPVALVMGVPWEDATTVGSLLGVKTILNEFIAYEQLGQALGEGSIGPRSALIASYALCGFANFGSLAILLGGIGGLVPSRRSEIAALGLRAILSGSLATFMTGCVVGMLG